MAEYSRLASGQVISLGGATPVILPFAPTRIQISNQTRALAASGVTKAWWAKDDGQGAAFLTTTSAGPADGTSFVTTNGFSTFSAGLALQYGPVLNINTVTKANPAVVTTVGNHNLVTGDVVTMSGLFQTANTGMPQICDIPFVVTVTGATTFTIPWNTNQSNYTAYNNGAATVQATVKKILFPFLYEPGVSDITAISLGATTTVTTTAPHNMVVGQEVAFRISPQWGTVQLNSLPNVLIPGSPIYGFITAVNSATQVVVNINSAAFTAFTTNVPVTSVVGLTPAQMVAVGDNNFGATSTTINGPAIGGAFLNNTSQGFVIGSAAAGTAADIIDWVAYLDDLAL